MSSFFNDIKNIFLNQTIDDFEKIENNGKVHYKDKSFCFDSEGNINNCLLSSKDTNKSISFFLEIMKNKYMKKWKNNEYSFSKFGIYKSDLKPKLTYQYILENMPDFDIKEDYWISNWENILKEENYSFLNENIFEKFCYQKIIEYFQENISKNDYSEISKEFKQYFEVHSITECINKNMTYKIKSEEQIKNFSDLKIFENKIDCTYVMQGNIGTCYFLQAVSLLSNYGQLIYQLFPEEEIKEEGFYEICLYHEGEWYKILIDDYYLFDKRENEDDPLYFTFAQPAKGCLYSCFLEKAFAKINGSYPDIHGGLAGKAFEALTGFDSIVYSQNKLNYDLLKYLKSLLDKGYLIGGHSDGHAYSILGIENELDLILRNPWSSLNNNDEFVQKQFDFKNRINKKELIKYKEGKFILPKEYFQQFFNHGIALCFCWFGARVYTYKLEKLDIMENCKALYFTFEINENTRIAIRLHGNKKNSVDKCRIKLENLSNKNKTYNLNVPNELEKEIFQKNYNFTEYINDKEIIKGKYLIKVQFLTHNKDKKIKSKLLSIYIDKNIDIYYLGYSENEPDESIINNPSTSPFKIESNNYLYGETTKLLFEQYKHCIKLLKHLGYEINEGKGVYIQTIFTNELETIILTYKNSKIKRCFTLYKEKKKYIFNEINEIGNKKEQIYDSDEINISKGIKSSQRNFEHNNLDSERKIMELKISLYNFDFEKIITDSNVLHFKEDSLKCFLNKGNYVIELGKFALKFNLVGCCWELCNSRCLIGDEIMTINYEKNGIKKGIYAIVKRNTDCSFCRLNFDVYFQLEEGQIKIGTILKPTRFCFYKNLVEIISSSNDLKYIIIERGNCLNRYYEIKNEKIKDKTATMGTIEKVENCCTMRNIYKIVLKKRVDYKDKLLIIIGGIIIQN